SAALDGVACRNPGEVFERPPPEVLAITPMSVEWPRHAPIAVLAGNRADGGRIVCRHEWLSSERAGADNVGRAQRPAAGRGRWAGAHAADRRTRRRRPPGPAHRALCEERHLVDPAVRGQTVPRYRRRCHLEGDPSPGYGIRGAARRFGLSPA